MRTLFPLLLGLSACASTTTSTAKGGPRGLHASEHVEQARLHDERAKQDWRWPDSQGDRAPYAIPWVRSWDSSKDQERSAKIHRSQAAELQAEFVDACGDRSIESVSVSPIQRYGVGGWNTATGVVLYLTADAGMPDQLMADLKCHRAWMMLAPAGMEDCPLDLADIQVDARGDSEGITLSITVPDPAMVPELQRRAAHDLEHAARAGKLEVKKSK